MFIIHIEAEEKSNIPNNIPNNIPTYRTSMLCVPNTQTDSFYLFTFS